MSKRSVILLTLLTVPVAGTEVRAQSSSIGANKRKAEVGRVIPLAPREALTVQRNRVYEQYSWTSSPPRLPKTLPKRTAA